MKQIAKVRWQGKSEHIVASVQDTASGAGFLKRQKECCRTLGQRFITPMAYIERTIRKDVWVIHLLEMLRAWPLLPENPCCRSMRQDLLLFGVSSPSMRPQLGCHPGSPTIHERQKEAWHGMEWDENRDLQVHPASTYKSYPPTPANSCASEEVLSRQLLSFLEPGFRSHLPDGGRKRRFSFLGSRKQR